MNSFKQILVAVDLDASANQVLSRAAHLAKQNDAEVTILYVGYNAIPMYGGFMGEGAYLPSNALIDEDAVRAEMLEKLTKKAQESALSSASIVVEFGQTVDVILGTAQALASDLIIVGSHGRHGISLLLGSTANGVLHRASCDVLAVRIKE